jgi:hypothetical protein
MQAAEYRERLAEGLEVAADAAAARAAAGAPRDGRVTVLTSAP